MEKQLKYRSFKIATTFFHILLAIMITGALAFAFIILIGAFSERSFSHDKWLSASSKERASMANDLIDDHLPKGVSEDQVVAILGKPDGINTGENWGRERLIGRCFYVYDLGSSHGHDDAYLCVHFDADKNMMKAEVYGF